MTSDLPKVLHPVGGLPMLAHVLLTLEELGVGRTLVVVGHRAEQVRAEFAASRVEWVLQAEQLGTGHAVLMAGPALRGFPGTALVVCGDTPLLRAETLDALLARHRSSGARVTVLSTRVPDPTGYGRIVRDAGGTLVGIVEDRDATPEEKRIDEINSGVYAFDYPELTRVLSRLSQRNAQGEYYLTDTVRLLLERQGRAAAWCAPDCRELLGINTPEQLRMAEEILRARGRRATPGSSRR